jgi:hypothetical protein
MVLTMTHKDKENEKPEIFRSTLLDKYMAKSRYDNYAMGSQQNFIKTQLKRLIFS